MPSSEASLIGFLKRLSPIPDAFIDDMFTLYNPDTAQTDAVVNLDGVAKWLKVRKDKLMDTLRRSYTHGIDYTVAKARNPHVTGKYGANSYKQVLLTPDCFKRLCMRSHGKMAEAVRSYFIEVEALVTNYNAQLVAGISEEMRRMESASRANGLGAAPREQPHAGCIYVIRASDAYDSVYKVGRTRDLARRLREHATSRADALDVVFTYKTDDVKAVETCVRGWLRERQWKRGVKYNEVYKADASMIKQIVHGCDVGRRLKRVPGASASNTTSKGGGVGGDAFFIVVAPDMA